MEILSPQLLWIKNRCYRINITGEIDNGKSELAQEYIEEDLYNSDDEEHEYNIEETDNSRFQCSFHAPSVFFAQIIGSKGMTRRRIESETKSQIKIPKPGIQGDIVIIGPSRQSVVSTRRRIEIIVLASRNKQQFTHFLSIPFNLDHIKTNFIKFRDEILNGSSVFGLDASLFQHPDKLHLTLCTMALMDNEDRANADQLLQDCQESIIKPIILNHGKIFVEMVGIEYMNDDPGAIDILYGKIYSEPIEEIANSILQYFIRNGLMQDKHDKAKLHVTLINSLFRDENNFDSSDENQKYLNKRKTFDGRDILKLYQNYYFGKFELKEIHLSQRFSTACNGYYEATGVLKIV